MAESLTEPVEDPKDPLHVWIDQDLCTGDGLCEEIIPDVFVLLDDGLAYVREGKKIFAEAEGNPGGADGLAEFTQRQYSDVFDAAVDCPGECIFLEDADGNNIGPYGPKA